MRAVAYADLATRIASATTGTQRADAAIALAAYERWAPTRESTRERIEILHRALKDALAEERLQMPRQGLSG
jgi:hypothetical protein